MICFLIINLSISSSQYLGISIFHILSYFISSHMHFHKFYIKVITIHILVNNMENQLENKIKEALENVEPWQRVPTSVDGAFLVKTPEKGANKTIMVEINPLNDRGNPMKRRGLFLRQSMELEKFLEVLENESMAELLKTLDDLSGSSIKNSDEIKTLQI